jgi:hypothetical protein
MTLDEFQKKVREANKKPLADAPEDLLDIYRTAKKASSDKEKINNKLKELGIGKGGSTNAYDTAIKKEWKNNKIMGKTDPKGSQNNIDIGSTKIGDIEVKSSKSNFMLNDSIAKNNIWYIFEGSNNVVLIHGSCLPQCDEKAVELAKAYKKSLHEVREQFKEDLKIYGYYVYPRPNYSIVSETIKCLPNGIFDGSTYYIEGVYMNNNISTENILDYIRKFAMSANNWRQFRKSIEEDYSQKLGQKVVLLVASKPHSEIDGITYYVYNVKIKIGDEVTDISSSLSEKEINFIFNLPKTSNG